MTLEGRTRPAAALQRATGAVRPESAVRCRFEPTVVSEATPVVAPAWDNWCADYEHSVAARTWIPASHNGSGERGSLHRRTLGRCAWQSDRLHCRRRTSIAILCLLATSEMCGYPPIRSRQNNRMPETSTCNATLDAWRSNLLEPTTRAIFAPTPQYQSMKARPALRCSR